MTDTDDDLRAAREWLDNAVGHGYSHNDDSHHRATILRRLDQPACPRGSEVSDDVCELITREYDIQASDLRVIVDTLHAHLTAPPKVKKFECWGVILADGKTITGLSEGYAKETARIYPCSRVIKLVEADDADA